MAERKRPGEDGGESKTDTVRLRFAPQVGRDYVILVQRGTSFVQKILFSEWERMRRGEGELEWSVTKCTLCGEVVVRRCVYVDKFSGWAKMVDACGCCRVEATVGASAPPESAEVPTEPPTESVEVGA